MRIRINEVPASQDEIRRIIEFGAHRDDISSRKHLLRHLEISCYLAEGDQNRALKPRERLRAQYRQDGLVLFLGAGVSIGCGIPNWNNLIKDVLHQVGINNYDTLKQVGAFKSLLTQFDLAGHCCPSGKKEFATKLYKCLYGGAEFKKLQNLLSKMPKDRKKQAHPKQKPYWRKLRKEFAKNETLKAVGDLLILDNSKNRFRRNPQIHAVLTVNADNLLELYCLSKVSGNQNCPVTMVDRASVGDDPDAIPIYHLHGTLDARIENFMRTDSRTPDIGVKQNVRFLPQNASRME